MIKVLTVGIVMTGLMTGSALAWCDPSPPSPPAPTPSISPTPSPAPSPQPSAQPSTPGCNQVDGVCYYERRVVTPEGKSSFDWKCDYVLNPRQMFGECEQSIDDQEGTID